MKKGEIYSVPYPYTDFENFKIRPAPVLINFANDVTISYITSQVSSFSSFDVVIQPSVINRLSIPALIKTGKVITSSKKLFKYKLSKISTTEMDILDQNLMQILQLK